MTGMGGGHVYGGAVIPIPQTDEKNALHRSGPGIIWGEVIKRQRPFLYRNKQNDEKAKFTLVIRAGDGVMQRFPLNTDDRWYDAARALQPGEIVAIVGIYEEREYFIKDGTQKTARDFHISLLIPEKAITDPDEWAGRMKELPDAFYEARQVQAAKQYEPSVGPEYADDNIMFRPYD